MLAFILCSVHVRIEVMWIYLHHGGSHKRSGYGLSAQLPTWGNTNISVFSSIKRKYGCKKYYYETRMHSSMMRTARLLPVSSSMHCTGGRVSAPGGACSGGVVSAPGGGGGICSWGMSAPEVCLLPGEVSAPGGSTL